LLSKRIIPCLLLDGRGLVKTLRFQSPKYIGDPINAVKIFNEKFVDEIIFLDISAARQGKEPNFNFIGEIASECFIPFCYGGGIRTIEAAKKLFSIGVEKIAVNSAAIQNPELIKQLAEHFGSQSIVAAMDIKKNWLGKYLVMKNLGRGKTSHHPIEYAQMMQNLGAGELFVNSIDSDGVMEGFDINILRELSDSVSIPVTACGGAGSLEHIKKLLEESRVSAAACGSLFVFKGKHRAVLINYPSRENIKSILEN